MTYPDFNDHRGLSIPPMEKKTSGTLSPEARKGLLVILQKRENFSDDLFMDDVGTTWIDRQSCTALTVSQIQGEQNSILTITGEGTDYTQHRELFEVFSTDKKDIEVTTAVAPQERETA